MDFVFGKYNKYRKDGKTRKKYIKCVAYKYSTGTDNDSLKYVFMDFIVVLKNAVNRNLLRDFSGCKQSAQISFKLTYPARNSSPTTPLRAGDTSYN